MALDAWLGEKQYIVHALHTYIWFFTFNDYFILLLKLV